MIHKIEIVAVKNNDIKDDVLTVDPDFLVSRVIADAHRFQETHDILRNWLGSLKIYIFQYQDWQVALMDQANEGSFVSQQDFATYAEALSYALSEASKRIKETA